ncbi:MAG: hypothetical protein JXA92_07535 [candidate division Zixibacteria bacterium]|nr:hypothetical protein [candidate division Zixibacteria bacterium]
MGLSNLLASIAGEYTRRYLERANWNQTGNASSSQADNVPSETPVQPVVQPEVTDRYEPSNQTPSDNADNSNDRTETTDNEQPAVEVQPDGTYYYKRQARLDYKLNLSFDLAALMSTARSISEGDTEAVESLVTAGFGLSADFNIKGKQAVETNLTDETDPEKAVLKNLTRARSRQVGLFKVQSEDFALQSFYREATDIRRSLNVKVQDNHRRTVNKIAIRYRLDNRFSFALAERFNVQTRQMTGETPESLNGYFDAAGSLAEKGTPEMMATFFDAVEDYLTRTEDKLTAEVESFFQSAAAELGFTGELVETAASQLTGAIESFFNRVTGAVQKLESKLVPNTVQPESSEMATYALPPDLLNPALAQDQACLVEA